MFSQYMMAINTGNSTHCGPGIEINRSQYLTPKPLGSWATAMRLLVSHLPHEMSIL